MYSQLVLAGLFDNLNLTNWLMIGAGAVILLHVTGVFDFSNIPLIGPILKALNIQPKPKPNPVPVPLPVNPDVADSEQQVHQQIELQCQKLALELRDLRHFASELETDEAMPVLKACDVIAVQLHKFHQSHTKK